MNIRHSRRRGTAAGFTLIELLIVIAILATLAVVLLPNILGASDATNDSMPVFWPLSDLNCVLSPASGLRKSSGG